MKKPIVVFGEKSTHSNLIVTNKTQIDFSMFQINPMILNNHNWHELPIGRCDNIEYSDKYITGEITIFDTPTKIDRFLKYKWLIHIKRYIFRALRIKDESVNDVLKKGITDNNLHFGIGGEILEMTGNEITKIKILEISII